MCICAPKRVWRLIRWDPKLKDRSCYNYHRFPVISPMVLLKSFSISPKNRRGFFCISMVLWVELKNPLAELKHRWSLPSSGQRSGLTDPTKGFGVSAALDLHLPMTGDRVLHSMTECSTVVMVKYRRRKCSFDQSLLPKQEVPEVDGCLEKSGKWWLFRLTNGL